MRLQLDIFSGALKSQGKHQTAFDIQKRAAEAAIQAGPKKGVDSAELSASEKSRLRRNAFDWIRAKVDELKSHQNDKNCTSETIRKQAAAMYKNRYFQWHQDEGATTRVGQREFTRWKLLWADLTALLKPSERRNEGTDEDCRQSMCGGITTVKHRSAPASRHAFNGVVVEYR